MKRSVFSGRRGLPWCFGLLSVLFCVLQLSGCAALTGIPGHGGGKRFAIEQELVAAATRTAIRQIDLGAIRGRKVNIYVNAMGDTGAGNLTGGRFSIVSQLHGYYQQQPQVKETYIYPRYESSSTTTSSSSSTTENSGGLSSGSSTRTHGTQTTTSSSLLASPSEKRAVTRGGAAQAQLGLQYEGLGAYHNSEEFNTEDLQFLTAIVQTYLFLEGVQVVAPSEAEVDVYITVDVFGTVYTRVDWFVANNEILRARTGLEVFAVETESGALLMSPQQAVADAEYNEQYILWAGPVRIRKSVQKGEPLLADFRDAGAGREGVFGAERVLRVPVPFQHELGERRAARARAREAKADPANPEKQRKRFRKRRPAAPGE